MHLLEYIYSNNNMNEEDNIQNKNDKLKFFLFCTQ